MGDWLQRRYYFQGMVKKARDREAGFDQAVLVRISLSCGLKGLSAATVVFIALATGKEIDYAQCRCTRAEQNLFASTA